MVQVTLEVADGSLRFLQRNGGSGIGCRGTEGWVMVVVWGIDGWNTGDVGGLVRLGLRCNPVKHG